MISQTKTLCSVLAIAAASCGPPEPVADGTGGAAGSTGTAGATSTGGAEPAGGGPAGGAPAGAGGVGGSGGVGGAPPGVGGSGGGGGPVVDCDAPTTACGAECVDLLTDAAHCGQCGRDCTFGGDFPSATCSAGECTPVTLANRPFGSYCGPFGGPGFGAPVATSDSDSYVYFASATNVYHVPKSGGLALESLEDCGGFHGLHHSGGHVVAATYLGQGVGGRVYATTSLAPNPEWSSLIDPHCGSTQTTASNARGGVWVEGQGPLRACADTIWVPSGVALSASGQPFAMNRAAAGGTGRAWWFGADGNIWSWPSPSGGAELAYSDNDIRALFGFGDTLFYNSLDTSIGGGGPAIIRAQGAAVSVIATPTNASMVSFWPNSCCGRQPLAADADHVCWLESTGVFCVPNTGSFEMRERVGIASFQVESLAVDSTSVYWTEADYINLTIYLRRAPL